MPKFASRSSAAIAFSIETLQWQKYVKAGWFAPKRRSYTCSCAEFWFAGVASFVCFYKLNIRATRFYTIKIVSYQSELIHDFLTFEGSVMAVASL